MDLVVTEFLSGLLAIVLLDLVLAGDNAIVIALAARRLPRHIQKKPCCGAPWARSRCACC